MRFSIVVPTRDRASCLPAAIDSCLQQQHGSFEVIVSDNCNDSDTRHAVSQFDDTRLRYVRSDKFLSMVDHWEFAIGHATGDFVLVLGDDDALLRHALIELDRLLLATGSEVIRWDWAYYGWPNGVVFDGGCDFYCDLPNRTCSEVMGVTAVELLTKDRGPSYCHLPMLYNAVVARSLIKKVKDRFGRFFSAFNPDVCSGITVACSCDSFWSSGLPMSIAGLSPKSNGLQNLHGDGSGAVANEFWQSLEFSRISWQESVPMVRGSIAMAIADSLVGVSSAGLLHPSVRVDRKSLIAACVREMSSKNAESLAAAVETIRCVLLRDHPEDLPWLDAIVQDCRGGLGSKMVPSANCTPEKGLNLGVAGSIMRQRLVDYGVTNSSDAAEWYERTFRCAECPRDWSFVPLSSNSDHARPSLVRRGLGRLMRAGRVLFTGR